MSNSVLGYEEDAQRARAKLELQLEALQSRLTPQGLADEAVGALRRSQYGRLADDAVATMRRNPFPVVLAGAALAIFAVQFAEERARRRGRNASAPRRGPERDPLRDAAIVRPEETRYARPTPVGAVPGDQGRDPVEVRDTVPDSNQRLKRSA